MIEPASSDPDAEIRMPLLDRTDTEVGGDATLSFVPVPLPVADPDAEAGFVQGVFATEMSRPANVRMVVEAAPGEGDETLGKYGLLFHKPGPDGDGTGVKRAEDPLVGAIGVAVEILELAFLPDPVGGSKSGGEPVRPVTVVGRAVYRFVVKEVQSTFPFITATVAKFPDVDTPDVDGSQAQKIVACEDRCLEAMRLVAQRRIEELSSTSVLEDHIEEMKRAGAGEERQLSLLQGKEVLKTVEGFSATLDSIGSIPSTERTYALGMVALDVLSLSTVSMESFSSDFVREALVMVDGMQRVERITAKIEEEISLLRARALTRELKDTVSKEDEYKLDLKIGAPSLPPWAAGIQVGTRLEYYWNEDYGWTGAQIVKRMEIAGELLFDVLFDDGETHRLPFLPEDKIRWRPPS